jgi:cholesterol oxidase
MSAGSQPGTPGHFDAIVVGSGFGGSVTAARLAEADWRVCVLERGKPYPPNSFPRSPLGLKNNFWDPSEGLHGMFDLWTFDGLDAVCASGLGGGSLIYANVFLRKDEHWFVHENLADGGYENWPVSRADLDPHYDEVERRVGVQYFPIDQAPYDQTPKVLNYRDAAERVARSEWGQAAQAHWSLVPLAVTFANQGAQPVPGEPITEPPNLHRRTRETCRLCGECDIGCNYGSKNTLDFTYLSAAWRAGADIRTGCEVRAFEPRDAGGYQVHYVIHDPASEGNKTDTANLERHTLTCDHLVLSAGTLGTTWLLLRNRSALPGLSDQLGYGFSGNGDLLTFAVRATQSGPDGQRVPLVIEPGLGPVITSALRVADQLDGGQGRGFYLEDAGYPQFASWMLELLQSPEAIAQALPRAAHYVWSLIHGHRHSEVGDLASALFGDCTLSSGLLPLLGMGRDTPDGVMSLKDGRLEVAWSKDGPSRPYFDRVREASRRIAQELGAEFHDNPIWHEHRVITVHSLGGCRMGASGREGVVDPHGNVYGHPGLHVADGSVMPGPVGANPSLTIAALADRFADAILEGGRGTPPGSPPVSVAVPDLAATAEPAGDATSLSFTEEMKGYVTFGEADFDRGYRAGRQAGTRFMFHLTITTNDVDRFISDPQHTADAEGWIESDAFGGRLPVTSGVFNLFVEESAQAKRMLYRLQFADGEAHPLTMTGFKEVRHGDELDLWSETTTLFVHVLAGHVAAEADTTAEAVASGILHILPLDFARQLTTFRVHPADRIDALGRFGALFAGSLWDVYRPRKDA